MDKKFFNRQNEPISSIRNLDFYHIYYNEKMQHVEIFIVNINTKYMYIKYKYCILRIEEPIYVK
ncbi:hypothetical protein CLTEP_28300 [Clostridium tepidiprofundi DSM 19306]|uniref:Uncharacterized protein n=1 Tax=Clostridium tepidiprofundi DSM 19306 TaxID=1121338 RepID=A0A151A8C0_9CLOT|nr:hypothetical protein [Clostridium tepidiprofundi]KYH23742.1 hypothetical protein CLTEP_28300 [Clostridium tepidiprofundi DSM 19306]